MSEIEVRLAVAIVSLRRHALLHLGNINVESSMAQRGTSIVEIAMEARSCNGDAGQDQRDEQLHDGANRLRRLEAGERVLLNAVSCTV